MTAAIEGHQPLLPVLPGPISLERFIAWYPEQTESRYELRRGAIIEMPKPRGKHSEVAGLLHDELALEIRRLRLDYFIPRECLIKRTDDTGYEPDVVVLDRASLDQEPLWQTSSVIEMGQSVKLVVEVVSSNWQDDYELKMVEYEAIGIPEYWIIDYAGIGGTRHIGKPKQPTLTIAALVNGEYEISRFRGNDPIISPTFLELTLTAATLMQL